MREMILQITMWIVIICTYISYIPQIIKLIKTKKADDLLIISWVLWTLSAVANLIYSVILARGELIISSISEAGLILAVFVLTVYYNYKNNYYLESEAKYNSRLRHLEQIDGNHMMLAVSIIKDRERRIQNRSLYFNKSHDNLSKKISSQLAKMK